MTAAVAYSYVRFSHPSQAEGDSLRRQTEAAQDWCRRNGAHFDPNLTLHDLGKSAFTGGHRKNPDRHALAAFLKLVEAGKVPRGNYLIVESLDRLTREDIQPALLLVLNLLQAGVRIVQLKPVEMVFDDRSDTLPVMMMLVELSRGHSESAVKSDRVGGAWAEKRRRLREGLAQKATGRMGDGCHVLTRRLPAWVELHDGRPRLVPGRAEVVKRIFRLAAGGYGAPGIVKRLEADKVPGFGRLGRWSRTYVTSILKDRRALGEFQPRLRDGTPDGGPIPDYYPAVVTEGEWDRAMAGMAQRLKNRGRTGRTVVNVFAGLLRHARDGDRFHLASKPRRDKGARPGDLRHVLLNKLHIEGLEKSYSFPFYVFERALLGQLREVDPREVLGEPDAGNDDVLALSDRLTRVESSIALIEAEMDANGESPTLFRRLRDKEAERKRLAEGLAEKRRKAASPLTATWGEAQALMAALDSAPDPEDARLRLRAAIRRIVESVWMLVVRRGSHWLCAVQVHFRDDGHRDYLIQYQAAGNFRPGGWWARAMKIPVAVPSELDLRRRDHAEALARALEAADIGAVED
jgi:DNA invertase Pin-like site-specific DNA recombinase